MIQIFIKSTIISNLNEYNDSTKKMEILYDIKDHD